MPRFFDYLPEALKEGQPFALGIISRIKGSSPQKAGAKALFFADGRIKGTLGGGCLEAEIQDRARRALLTAGSGHVAQAVAPLALQLDFEVTVFDDRPTLANTQFFPPTTRFRVDYWEKLLAEPMPPRPTFGLIVTRGHQHDALVLRDWLHRPFEFLGMIGSKRKARLIFSQFIEEEIAREEQL